MNPPRRDWGKAIVTVPWNQPDKWMNGIVLPVDYELAEGVGAFFSQPQSMGFGLVVTGPDIPQVPDHEMLPMLETSNAWQKIVVYPYNHK